MWKKHYVRGKSTLRQVPSYLNKGMDVVVETSAVLLAKVKQTVVSVY